jgi:hypothetical protein
MISRRESQPAPSLRGFPHKGPDARLCRGPLFGRRFRLARPQQHITEIGHGRGNVAKESIDVSLAQDQDSAMDTVRQLAVIPAEDLQDIGDLLRPEHRAGKSLRVRGNTHASKSGAMFTTGSTLLP